MFDVGEMRFRELYDYHFLFLENPAFTSAFGYGGFVFKPADSLSDWIRLYQAIPVYENELRAFEAIPQLEESQSFVSSMLERIPNTCLDIPRTPLDIDANPILQEPEDVYRTVKLGTYGKEKRPIEWLVLAKEKDKDTGKPKVLLLSKEILHYEQNARHLETPIDDWAYEFYKTAFSNAEKKCIFETVVQKHTSNYRQDKRKLFRLKEKQINKYFRKDHISLPAPDAPYARDGIDEENAECYGWAGLLEPTHRGLFVSQVFSVETPCGGMPMFDLRFDENAANRYIGIRPAMYVDPNILKNA